MTTSDKMEREGLMTDYGEDTGITEGLYQAFY